MNYRPTSLLKRDGNIQNWVKARQQCIEYIEWINNTSVDSKKRTENIVSEKNPRKFPKAERQILQTEMAY